MSHTTNATYFQLSFTNTTLHNTTWALTNDPSTASNLSLTTPQPNFPSQQWLLTPLNQLANIQTHSAHVLCLDAAPKVNVTTASFTNNIVIAAPCSDSGATWVKLDNATVSRIQFGTGTLGALENLCVSVNGTDSVVLDWCNATDSRQLLSWNVQGEVKDESASTSSSASSSATKSLSSTLLTFSSTTISPSKTSSAPNPGSTTSIVPNASPSPINLQGSNNDDPFDISNTLFDGTCAFYINTVKANLANSISSGNINNGGVTSFRQYDCTINDFTRCPAGPGTWGGDADWVWNKAISSNTDPYRYNVIWFMQLIGDSDDLFHECDDDPRAFDVSRFATTPLNLKPDCITFGKWCRTWAGHVAQGKTITVQGAEYSVEAAFLKLSSNRIKIDFKDETIYKSYLRSGMTLDEQVAIAEQFREDGTGNCITDQHFCYECNDAPGHCTAGEGCLRYKFGDGSFFCP